MFFPKAMTEIELIVPAKDLLPVTKVLSGHGIFHQSDSSYSYPGAESEKGASESWQNKAAAFAGLERRLQLTMQSLTIEEGDTPASDFETITDPALVLPEVERIELEVKNTNDQVVSTQKNLEALHASLSQLESIQDVPADFSALRDSKYVYSVLGMIPAANVDRLETSLSRIPHVFLTLRSEPQKKVVWLAGAQANADVLERALPDLADEPMKEAAQRLDSPPIDPLVGYFSGQAGKQKIRELIAFCRQGAFRLELD